MTATTNRLRRLAQILALCPVAACGPGLETSPGWSDRWEVCGKLGGPPPGEVAAGHDVLAIADENRIEVRDMPSGVVRLQIPLGAALGDSLFGLMISPDGSMVLRPTLGGAPSRPDYLARWSLVDGTRSPDVTIPAGAGWMWQWSPQGRRAGVIVNSGGAPNIYVPQTVVMDMPAGTVAAQFPGMLMAMPDEDSVVVVRWDQRAIVRLRLADQSELARTSIPDDLDLLSISPDGTQMLVTDRLAGPEPTTRMMRISDGAVLWSSPAQLGGFSDDGRFVYGTASGWSQGTMTDRNTTWLAADGTQVTDWGALYTSRDGSVVFSLSNTVVSVYGTDLAHPAQIIGHDTPGHRVSALAFGGSSELLIAVAADQGQLTLWRHGQSEKPLWSAVVPGVRAGLITSLDFSPDGSLLLAAGPAVPGTLWRVADGTLLHTFNDPTKGETIYSLAFSSSDGALIVGGPAATPTIRLWRTADLTELTPLQTTRQNAAARIGGNFLMTSAPEEWQIDPPALLWRGPDGYPGCVAGGDWVAPGEPSPDWTAFVGRPCNGGMSHVVATNAGVTLSPVRGEWLAQGYRIDGTTGAVWNLEDQRLGTLPMTHFTVMAGAPSQGGMMAVADTRDEAPYGVFLLCDRSR